MNDASFKDGAQKPLNLAAHDAEGLQILSALSQDSVFPINEMQFDPNAGRFALLINRFRWEDVPVEAPKRPDYERVQSVLAFDGVLNVATQGIDRTDKDVVLSLLSISFEPTVDGAGAILLTLAGDGAIRLNVEMLDLLLKDVTRNYIAPSKRAPSHPE